MAKWTKKQAKKRLEKRLAEIKGMSEDERNRLFRKAEIRQLWYAGRADMITEKLYSWSRTEVEDLEYDLLFSSPIYDNPEDDPEFELQCLISGVMIQTDPSLTQEDIEKLNNAARTFLEEANS